MGHFEDKLKGSVSQCVKVTHRLSLEGMKAWSWTGVLVQALLLKAAGWSLYYKPPVVKQVGDLQWRMVQGWIATDMHAISTLQYVMLFS